MEQMETQLLSNYSREGGEGEREGGSRYTVIRYINTLHLIFFLLLSQALSRLY